MTHCDFSIARPSVSVETEPEKFPYRTSVSDSFRRTSANVGTIMTIDQYPKEELMNLLHLSNLT